MNEILDIAQNIRRIRLNAGLTQTEFAIELGTNSTSVSRWERGDALPQKNVRVKMMHRFEVDPEALGLPVQIRKQARRQAAPGAEGVTEWMEDSQGEVIRRIERIEARLEKIEHVLQLIYNRSTREM